jgi:beta-galactosidase
MGITPCGQRRRRSDEAEESEGVDGMPGEGAGRSILEMSGRTLGLVMCALAWVASGTVLAAEHALPSVATLEPTLELRQVGDLVVPFQSGLPLPTYEPQSRPKIELFEGWVMRRASLDHRLSLAARAPAVIRALEEEGGGAHGLEFDDARWERTRLPWAANPPGGAPAQGVWYRRRVGIPPLWRDRRRLLLHCLAANYVADVWVNGAYVGYHEGGCTPFSFDITEHVRWDGGNVIAMRVDNPPWLPERPEGLPSQEIVPYGPCDWWNATGVLRDMYLEAVPIAAVVRADVRSERGAEETRLRVAAVVRNGGEEPLSGKLAATVYPARVSEANLTAPLADGIAVVRYPVPVTGGTAATDLVVSGETTVAWELAFSTGPLRVWNPRQPNLYVLEVRLEDEEGKTLDRVVAQFGVRRWAVEENRPRLLLNGERVVLGGVGRVEDDPRSGRALTFRDGLRVLLDLKSAKWVGANFLHMGHFVNHPLTAILADRMGLVCWEEIPVSWFDARGLAIQWERRRIARQMFVEMMYQDYNRPSVGFWGMCHQSGWGEAHVHYLRDLVDIARYLDGTRLVGQSAGTENPGAGQGECDVQGYALGVADHPEAGLGAETGSTLDRLRVAVPNKPLIVTEFGAAAGAEAATAELQAWAARAVVGEFAERPGVAGCVWWSLADYVGAKEVRDSGLVSRDRRTTRPVCGVLREAYQGLYERAIGEQ